MRAVIGLVMGRQPALAESTAQPACQSPQARGTTLGDDLLTVSQNVARPQTGLDTKNEEVS
jgi:hypothetical protein